MRLAGTFALLCLVLLLPASGSGRPLRLAYGEAPPYCYTAEDGKPTGFLIAVFTEAARRAELEIQWTLAAARPEDNDKALIERSLDIMPMSVAHGDRKRTFYVTEPWWSDASILLIRAESPNTDPAAPARIALPRVLAPAASAHYRNSSQVLARSAPDALEKLCTGASDAALVGANYIHQLVNSRPKACESVRLRTFESPVTADFAIIASPSVRPAAERLHDKVVEMTRDGTLAQIAGAHPPISTPYATRMAENLRNAHSQQRLTILLFSVSAFLVLGVAALIRQILTQRRLRDTIERHRRAEQALRESEAALHQRTLELARSNEDLQAFAYSVSHDLQEPVRNQALFSELLERRFAKLPQEESLRLLGVIRANAVRAQVMISSLLVYSRAGHDGREAARVDCDALVKGVLSDLRLRLDEAGATVEVGPLPAVWGWEDRLHQVFQNLLENAVKYRKADAPPRIEISAVRSGSEWRFSIADNGIGFKQDYADKVFGLFKRLHGHDRYMGSGIGLALCKRVVERHGGRIWANSREGAGSTFYFTIPVDVQRRNTAA